MTNNHYDVIIIGTGAGGGTLAYRLAPVGQAHPAPRARRLRPPREGQLETRTRSTSRRSTRPRRSWNDARGQARSTRTPTTTSAATPNSTARRCSGCGARTSASSGITAASRRPGRSRYDDLEPYYTEGRAPLPRARSARRGSDRAARERAVPVSGGQPRAAHPAAQRRLRRAGPAAVPRAARHHARRAATRTRAAASAATPATASRASSTRRPTRRSSASIRRSSIPNVTLLTDAYVERLETSASGREVTRVIVERDGATETLRGGHRRRRRAARSTRRRCCCARRTTGIRAASRTARTWSDATTWATSTRC